MRSSIACVRCRRSKVKCVNTGPNTTCRACDGSNRECTYPQPVVSGTPRVSGSSMTVNSHSGAGSGLGSGGGERLEAPKKTKPKKPSSGANAAATAASMNTPASWKECLGASVLTQTVWQLIFDAFQSHHSPVLPFLHPPTFLNRLRASAGHPGSSAPSGSTSPPPEKPHSPLLLLGMLTLVGRHIAPLVSHHSPALPTPTAVSEYYASALKYRLKNEDEDSLLVPSLDKVQALVMLSIHEWGQTRKAEAYMWLGLAIRMSGALALSWVDADDAPSPAPYSPQPETDDGLPLKRRKLDNGTPAKPATAVVVEKEIRRRTFWAVFVLDRALSSGRYFPSGISSTDASRVQLPSDERAFMFGADTKTGYLDSDALLHPRDGHVNDIAAGERILAHIVKAMELWGQIQVWTETTDPHPPASPRSEYHRLSIALDAFVDSLPHQLEFSGETLQVHFSTRSSSSYTILHVTLFLARITLERKCLPDLPFVSPQPLGPADTPSPMAPEDERFYAEAAERYLAASRDLVVLISLLDEWNATIESPFIISALERAARSGLYVYTFPWMDTRGHMTGSSRVAGAEPKGSGEETRKAIEFIAALKPRWGIAKESFANLLQMHAVLSEKTTEFLRTDQDSRILEEKLQTTTLNQEERTRLFAMLAPPTPKPGPVPAPASQGRGPSSEVDTLLLAATGAAAASEPVVATGSERWMAVNTPIPAITQQHVPAPKSEEGGLDALAGFAAERGKIGNGQDYGSRDVEMGEAGIKKEESQSQSEERRWIDNGVKAPRDWAINKVES